MDNIKIWSIKQYHVKTDLKDTKLTISYVLFRKRITILPVSPNEYEQHPMGKLQMQMLFRPNHPQASVQHQHYLSLYPSQEPFGEAEILISNQLTKIILNDKTNAMVYLSIKAQNHGAYIFVAVI
jgi:hypothetical protein